MDTNTGLLSMICHQEDPVGLLDVKQERVYIVPNVKYTYVSVKKKIVS